MVFASSDDSSKYCQSRLEDTPKAILQGGHLKARRVEGSGLKIAPRFSNAVSKHISYSKVSIFGNLCGGALHQPCGAKKERILCFFIQK